MTRKSGRVVVVGSANVDLVLDVERRPQPGETLAADSYRFSAGGKGANQAVAAARAGADVCFVGCVGDDAWGEDLRRELVSSGVRPLLGDARGAPTGIAFITVTPDGENSIVIAAGANADVDEELLREVAPEIEAAEVLLVQLEIPLPAVTLACRLARNAGTRVVLTPAPATAGAKPLLELVDVVVPNLGEARGLVGDAPPGELVRRLCASADAAVLTLGDRGALVARASTPSIALPAPAVGPVVDTTGAGDTLAGVLGARLAAGDDLETAARAGVVAASISVTRPGAQTSIPGWEETSEILSVMP
ncbi:MAG: ribokinase [Gaiellaceae bacterium]|jgi:ribokinase